MDIQSHFHLFEAKFATTNVQLVRGKGGRGEGKGVDLVKFGGLTMVTTLANNDTTALRGRSGSMMFEIPYVRQH